jgi:hypothetical protein
MLLNKIDVMTMRLKSLNVEVGIVKMKPVIDSTKWNELLVATRVNLPETLRKIYVEESGGVIFNWVADYDLFGKHCSRGCFHLLSPDEIISAYKDMCEMVQEGKNDTLELESNDGMQALVTDWEGWIPIFRFPNGDAFCIDSRNDNSIVFLEHDVMDGGPYIHGTKLAKNIEELVSNWEKIGFVDFYDWSQCIGEDGIDIGNNVFNQIRKAIN